MTDFELENENFEANPRFTKKCKVDGLLISEDGQETNISRMSVSLVKVFEGYNSPRLSTGIRYAGGIKEIPLHGDEVFQIAKEWQQRDAGSEATLFESWADRLGPLGLTVYKFTPKKWSSKSLEDYFGVQLEEWKTKIPLVRASTENEGQPWYIEPCEVWHNLVVTLSWAVNVVKFLKDETQFSRWVRYPHKKRGEVIVPDAFGPESDPFRVLTRRGYSQAGNSPEIAAPLGFPFLRSENLTLSDDDVEKFVHSELERRIRHLTSSHVGALPNPFTGELELSARSLYGFFILFLLEILVGDVEFFVCPGCGQTRTATGKAVGKGKTYCSDRCKKRCYRRKDREESAS